MVYEITTNDLGIKVVRGTDITYSYKETTLSVTHTGNFLYFPITGNSTYNKIDLTQPINFNGEPVKSLTDFMSYLEDFLTGEVKDTEYVDHIYEKTSGHGVDVDGVLLKDTTVGGVYMKDGRIGTGIVKEVFVDQERTDSYIKLGTREAPYTSIMSAITAIQALATVQIALGTQVAYDTTRYIINVAPGLYSEALIIGNMKYLGIKLNGATISGNIAITTTQVGGAVTDDYSKVEFIGAPSSRAYRGRCGVITGAITMTRNNASLMYVNFTGVEIAGNLSVGSSTADSNGSWVVGLQNAYFSQSSKYISCYTADPTAYIMLESFGYNVIKCKIAKQDNSATQCNLYNINNTSFENDINITPTENCIIKNSTFTSTKSFSIVATKTLYIDANSYKQLEAATEVLTGMTISPLDGVLPTATTLGFFTGNTERWVINGSNAFVPEVDNSYDIGNLASNPRDIHASRSLNIKGVVTSSRYGLLYTKYSTITHTTTNARTNVIAVQVPTDCTIIAVQVNNDTAIDGLDDATGLVHITSYIVTTSGGVVEVVSSTMPLTANSKKNKMWGSFLPTSGVTDITIDADEDNKFVAGGKVTVIVYYNELTSITNA